jgi:hypothetical protein
MENTGISVRCVCRTYARALQFAMCARRVRAFLRARSCIRTCTFVCTRVRARTHARVCRYVCMSLRASVFFSMYTYIYMAASMVRQHYAVDWEMRVLSTQTTLTVYRRHQILITELEIEAVGTDFSRPTSWCAREVPGRART